MKVNEEYVKQAIAILQNSIEISQKNIDTSRTWYSEERVLTKKEDYFINSITDKISNIFPASDVVCITNNSWDYKLRIKSWHLTFCFDFDFQQITILKNIKEDDDISYTIENLVNTMFTNGIIKEINAINDNKKLIKQTLIEAYEDYIKLL